MNLCVKIVPSPLTPLPTLKLGRARGMKKKKSPENLILGDADWKKDIQQ